MEHRNTELFEKRCHQKVIRNSLANTEDPADEGMALQRFVDRGTCSLIEPAGVGRRWSRQCGCCGLGATQPDGTFVRKERAYICARAAVPFHLRVGRHG